MKNKIKSALIPLMLLAVVFLFCACGRNTQFDQHDDAGYTVSVKFDANGGEFTTNCSVIYDSFNISGMTANSNGMVELALITPDNPVRGANDTYNVAKNGYFLAGWYATRNEHTDSEGNVTYSYADKWDFEKGRLEVDPNKDYTSTEPVVTLYAVWVPMFEINFYNLGTGELLKTEVYNPMEISSFQVPEWDMETGKIKMYKFPTRNGYTFNGVYMDAEGTEPIEGTMTHIGSVDYSTGNAVNPSMNVYVDWLEGDWYHIYTAQQLASNATKNGCYVLHADLDFTDVVWPSTFMYGDFNGTIIGNDHFITNVTIVQTNNSATRFGLFGGLTADATLKGINFQNITAVIQSGVRANGSAYGLFAGNISKDATISDVSIFGGQLQIDSDCVLMANDYAFGLVCGMGDPSVIHFSKLEAVAVGANPEKVQITVNEDDGMITVVIE